MLKKWLENLERIFFALALAVGGYFNLSSMSFLFESTRGSRPNEKIGRQTEKVEG